jgi:hypothetical protein
VAIRQHIASLDNDTTRVMVDAYEAACRDLSLPAGTGPANNRVADLVLRMVQDGERDPQSISRRILTVVRQR